MEKKNKHREDRSQRIGQGIEDRRRTVDGGWIRMDRGETGMCRISDEGLDETREKRG